MLLIALSGSAWAQAGIAEAERGIVRVVVILDGPDGRVLYGSGSGFVVAPNLVVTSAHVVAVARQQPQYSIGVVPSGGDGFLDARIVRYSPLSDLALLEFFGDSPIAPLTISTIEPGRGDRVLSYGYPDVDYQGASGTDLLRPAMPSRDPGEIASLSQRAPNREDIPSIYHTAIISSGSSGGPLLDECGRVIGVNSWAVTGAQTRAPRSVAMRVNVLLQFLDEAGVTPTLIDERCLTGQDRERAERAAEFEALQTQNRELASKLETADRLTRTAVVVLLAGTVALFVAVCVLGVVLLRRNRRAHDDHGEASRPEPFESSPRRRVGIMAIVTGSAVAAVLIIGAGVALWRVQEQRDAADAPPAQFAGEMNCTFDADASVSAEPAANTVVSASGSLCVNERTLYALDGEGRRYQRAIVRGDTRALWIWSIDPESGEFRRESYPLTDDQFAQANQAVAETPGAGRRCESDPEAVTRRNSLLMRLRGGEPTQRLVWRCVPRG